MRDIFIDGYKLKKYNSSNWVRIYHQNSNKGGFFNSFDQCKFSLKKNLFSVIGLTDDSFKIKNNFHYLLYYKEIDAHFEWQQTTSMLDNVTSVNYIVYKKVLEKIKNGNFSNLML